MFWELIRTIYMAMNNQIIYQPHHLKKEIYLSLKYLHPSISL